MHCLFVLVRSEAALNLRRFCNACAPTIVPLFLRAWGWLVASGQCVYVCRGSGSRNNEKTMHSYHWAIGHRHFVSKNPVRRMWKA